jgi:hypothetical protein
MGATQSSAKEVDNKKGAVAAGHAVRMDSAGVISVDDGALLGISLGKDLSDIGRTAVCRKGLKVPVALTAEFTPAVGAQVSISDTTGKAIAAGGGATAVNAVYVSGVLTGIAEDGSEIDVALIDFPGGL